MSTPFLETEALLAVMNGDERLARTLVHQMLPRERGLLVAQLAELSALLLEANDLPGVVPPRTGGK